MLQIANETLQAQCKVSTTSNPKPTPPHDGNPGEECVRSAEWRARVLRPARPDCRLTLSPIIERTQAAVEREEEIKEAMNDALGASQRRITDLEGELEHAKAIAAAAEKSPDQGTEEGGDSSELEKLRKKLNVSAGLVKKLRDSENDLRDELAAAQRRIAEGVKDRDAEERAVATQRNLLQKTEEDVASLRDQLRAKEEEAQAREEANAEASAAQASRAEELQERVEALEAEVAESKATLERKELESGAMTAAAFDSANAQANKSEELQHELEALRAELEAANERTEQVRIDANTKIERAEAAYRSMEEELAAAKAKEGPDPSLQAQLDKKKTQLGGCEQTDQDDEGEREGAGGETLFHEQRGFRRCGRRKDPL